MICPGMPADDLLKMKGRTGDLIEKIEVVGEDDQGFIVEWTYADCVVVMHRRLNRYRVREVRDAHEGMAAATG